MLNNNPLIPNKPFPKLIIIINKNNLKQFNPTTLLKNPHSNINITNKLNKLLTYIIMSL